MTKYVFPIWIIILLSLAIFGQQTETERVRQERDRFESERLLRRQEDRLNGQSDGIERNNRSRGMEPATVLTPTEREILRKKAEQARAEREEFLEDVNRAFSPPTRYYNEYAEFLKHKNTGLARMFPEKNCGPKNLTVNITELERCRGIPLIPGGGSLYSFRLYEIPDYFDMKSITYFVEISDIHFVGDRLTVGGYNTQSIIVDIGQTDITEIYKNSEPMKFLKEFKSDKRKSHFQAQKQIIEKGINENGFLYSSSALVKPGNSYILRSIAYSTLYKSSFPKNDFFWNTDILVAFQIVGRESDGSIIFAWKKFMEKNAPELKNN